jgi:hypothetical protein
MPFDASALTDNLGGLGVLAFALWLMWRTHRQDKAGTDAQVDQTAVALLKEMREERSAERKETREELGQVRERVAVLEHERNQQALLHQRHAAWDAGAQVLLRQQADPIAVSALGDPPPLQTGTAA